jgi:hypothetical protein
MRRGALTLALVVVLGALWLAPSGATAAFGFRPGAAGLEVTAIADGGATASLAGSHPYELATKIGLNLAGESPGQPGVAFSEGDLRDLALEMPPGLIENPDAVAKCPATLFHTARSSPFEQSASGESCPADSQVGVITLKSSYGAGSVRSFGVFNLVPPPGVAAQLGFAPFGVPVALTPTVRQAEGEYGLTLETHNFPQAFNVYGIELAIWGVPWGVSHDGQRGNCLNEAEPSFAWAKCTVGKPDSESPLAYLTLPTSCAGPLDFTARADSWQQPATVSASAQSSQGAVPVALQDCQSLHFGPHPVGQLTDPRASSASGYEFDLTGADEGLTAPRQRGASQVKQAVVALPEGVSVNPSVGAGLGVCTPAGYGAETAFSAPGEGCPNGSKIGDFTVQSPLFEEVVGGSIFLAQPDDPTTATPGAENPFNSMLALYLVAKAPARGILVKVAGVLHADPTTGRLTASFDNLPQLPYTNLKIHFREGQRAPLVTPPGCGPAISQITLQPWLGILGAFSEQTLSKIEAGIGGAPCPTGAAAPFTPGALGGTLNSNAGSYSPFYLHLTRTDAEQEITSYSAKLPPGLLGKIAGIPYCPEAAIEAAKAARGRAELEHPSCPAASEIGHTVSGYGLGPVLAYAPGRLYLAGPYHGSSFSVVAIDSALVGPFDLGVVIVRSAIEVNPQSAQVSIDSAGSDPIPHILAGIPIHLRDIRVYISRHELTINPTSCDPFTLSSTLTGSAAPFTNPIDAAATPTVGFQAFNCAALAFAPRFALALKGPTKRGGYPRLKATYTPRPGNANTASAAVTLPPSEFLAQNHIGTVCTRPQLAADACPAASVYGQAKAITPLLGVPLEGPVYLRSSNTTLPDLVAVLRGQGIRIVLEGRIDSVGGGIRAVFKGLPDAPVSKFVMTIFGGKKRGLLVNAANLCAAPQLAEARFGGQNNSGQVSHPQLSARCGKHSSHPKHRRHAR